MAIHNGHLHPRPRWKNDGCPSLAKKMDEAAAAPVARVGEGGFSRRRKRRLGDIVMKEIAEKKVNLGNANLTALWNQNPDNLGACRSVRVAVVVFL